MITPLQTARIVVIDDSEEEAAPLLLALAKMGLGAWHFTGQVDDLPDAPLPGIRVVFLDLRLDGAHTDHQAIPQTLAVLERIVGATSSAGIVFWSKHPDAIEEFRTRLARDLPKLKPAFVHKVESKQELVRLGLEGRSEIIQQIRTSLEKNAALSVLQEWEQVIHLAASATFDSLTGLAVGNDNQLDSNKLMNLLGALAASVGNDAASTLPANEILATLFEALGPLHFDRLSHTPPRTVPDDPRIQLLRDAIASPQRTDEQTTRVNSALLIAPVSAESAPFQPGDVFIQRPELGVRCPHYHCVMKKRDMVVDFNFPRDEHIKRFERDAVRHAERKAELDDAISARKKEIVATFHLILLELTPACDFAKAKKRATVRFIGGLLVPKSHDALVNRKCDYLRILPLVSLAEPQGEWVLVLNSRFLFGIARPQDKVESKPAFRLRSRVLIDIQSWVASQLARPGFDSL